MLTTIFCEVDDFCKFFEKEIEKTKLINCIKSKRKVRTSMISSSELLTILIYFHHSKYKDFKSYYNGFIRMFLRNSFGFLPSYHRFIELSHKELFHLFVFTKSFCLGRKDWINIIDSTPLKVCHNRRIHGHKTFKGLAKRGKTSTGWFFGFKVHLIINSHGEIVNFTLTTGNVSDCNIDLVDRITQKLRGLLLGDKGYISKQLFEKLFNRGVKLVTGIKKNMKNKIMHISEKILLKKRGIIESAINLLKTKATMEHSRHRSITGLIINTVASIAAYSFFQHKPSMFCHLKPRLY